MSSNNEFATKISYELKRAERYRIFLSLVVFNFGSVIDLAGNKINKSSEERDRLLSGLIGIIRKCSREIDHISNSGMLKIGLLMPETSRQGAEVAAKRITDSVNEYCSDLFARPSDIMVPVGFFVS